MATSRRSHRVQPQLRRGAREAPRALEATVQGRRATSASGRPFELIHPPSAASLGAHPDRAEMMLTVPATDHQHRPAGGHPQTPQGSSAPSEPLLRPLALLKGLRIAPTAGNGPSGEHVYRFSSRSRAQCGRGDSRAPGGPKPHPMAPRPRRDLTAAPRPFRGYVYDLQSLRGRRGRPDGGRAPQPSTSARMSGPRGKGKTY